jgi:uncharacterized protein (DUF2384 family)
MINNEKVYHELFNVTVFFSKAATKLTLDETIHKAQWLISKIEAKIKPGRDLANRTLKRHKKQLANLIKVQKRCEEVFDSTAAAEEWLTAEVIGPGAQTHRELMISDKGIEQVLDELGRDELMLSTKVAELKKSTKRARKSLDQGIRDAQSVLKKVRRKKKATVCAQSRSYSGFPFYQDRFVEALLSPPKATPALKRAILRHNKLVK